MSDGRAHFVPLTLADLDTLLAIDSLMIVADAARPLHALDDGHDVWVAMDARMEEVYAAHYQFQHARWHVLKAPALYTLPALAAWWEAAPPQRVAGNAASAFGARLPVGGAQTLSSPEHTQRAQALLRLARHGLTDGATIDPVHAAPLYLRDKVALTTDERAAARAARERSGA